MESYKVVYALFVHEYLFTVTSRREFDQLNKVKDLLKTSPDLGRVYAPEYPANKPDLDVECRVIAVGRFNLYYGKNYSAHRVEIFYLEGQRQDPQKRFHEIQ